MSQEHTLVIIQLLRRQRWAALATLGAGRPFVSQVAFAMDAGFDAALVHLSRLAAHTHNLLHEPQAALSISETDDGREDPQTLARVSLQVAATMLAQGSEAYESARTRYLARLPAAAPRFEFADFVLFRLTVEQARFVGGFASARSLSGAALQGLAIDSPERPA